MIRKSGLPFFQKDHPPTINLDLQIAQAVFGPARLHARRVVSVWLDGRRKTLVAPALLPRMFPVTRGVDQHAIPQSGAELRHVAVFHRRGGIDRRTENAWEDHHAAFTSVDA